MVAGVVGGWLVWGQYSNVNYQITLYVLSRVVVASVKLAAEKGMYPFSEFTFKQVLASV